MSPTSSLLRLQASKCTGRIRTDSYSSMSGTESNNSNRSDRAASKICRESTQPTSQSRDHHIRVEHIRWRHSDMILHAILQRQAEEVNLGKSSNIPTDHNELNRKKIQTVAQITESNGASPSYSLSPDSRINISEELLQRGLESSRQWPPPDGRHLRIGRLQTNLPARLAVKTFHRGFVFADKRHNDFSGIGHLRLLNDDVIAIEDVVVAHRFALHLQDEGILTAGKIRERNRLAGPRPLRAAGRRQSSCQRQLDHMCRSRICSRTGFGSCVTSIERLWL